MKTTSRKQSHQQIAVENNVSITTWKEFTAVVRSKGCNLLSCLDDFPNAVLVTGCQRSGTTMLTRIIAQSKGMVDFWIGKDDELDGALILSGYASAPSPGRYCFQTTYLDDCYTEYYEHDGGFKIIWVIRNPYSVVYSLLYNWYPDSLDGTFDSCAAHLLTGMDALLYRFVGINSINRTKRACEVYRAKTLQLFELYENMGAEKILIVDYDELILNKEIVLPKIYEYIQLEYNNQYDKKIKSSSINKKIKLSKSEKRLIKKIDEQIYQRALTLKKINN